jgi:hypothetical protein
MMSRALRAASLPIWIALVAAVLSLAVISFQRHMADRTLWLPSITVAAPAVQSHPAPAPAVTVIPPQPDPGPTTTVTPSLGTNQAPAVPQQAPFTNSCGANRSGSTMHPACVTGVMVPIGG